jgi:DNA-3-methyladenine glycosylase
MESTRLRSVEIGPDFFARSTVEVAKELLGKVVRYNGCGGIIVETEAYRDDPASHFVQRPKQGQMLKNTFGHIYIFLIYGIHYCLNFTTEKDGIGAVLIRALEPTEGIEGMMQRRGEKQIHHLTNGPGKLCQAMGIGMELLGKKVGEGLKLYDGAPGSNVQKSRRIGISKATHLEWRFFISKNPFVSRK